MSVAYQYQASNMFRSLKYMFDVDVIHEWNEKMVERAIEKYLSNIVLTE